MKENTANKKVGIITFHRTNNFGSQLQAFALYQAICNLGYNCEIIDYRCPAIESREFTRKELEISSLKTLIKYICLMPKLTQKKKQLAKFLINNAKLSCIYTPENISQSEAQYEKIIVGSDIVWGLDITEGDYSYFLDYVKDTKKIYAFASSVGDSKAPVEQEKIRYLLNRFTQICVRENDATQWVETYSDNTAKLVCDPTMLIPIRDWDRLICPKHYEKGYVLAYFDSDDGKCFKDAQDYAKAHNLKVYGISYGMPARNFRRVRPSSIAEFLGLIKNADMVFTASYHGMLFSLYYNVELLFYTRAHKERVMSLSQKLDIEDHCGDNYDISKYTKIDWKKVNRSIELFRSESMDLLRGELEYE